MGTNICGSQEGCPGTENGRYANCETALMREMSEWLTDHAWKSIPLMRSDAQQNPPTQFPSSTSCNNDVHRRVPVNDGVCPGFRGVVRQNSVGRVPARQSGPSSEATDCIPSDRVEGDVSWRERVSTDEHEPRVMPAHAALVSSTGAPAGLAVTRPAARSGDEGRRLPELR